jgi:glycerol-3-phosphate dehydrogenase
MLFQGLSSGSTSASLRLISEDIRDILGIDTAVLMGANLAPEVANDNVGAESISIFVIKVHSILFSFVRPLSVSRPT